MGTSNRYMKKIRINGYCHRIWTKGGFKQFNPIPCPFFVHNPLGHFIETGVSTNLWVISISFLIWDFGIQIYEDLEY
jgi:hypothetical protein